MEKKRIKRTTKRDLRKDIIAKAMVDPAFRRKLFQAPEEAFKGKLSKSDMSALERLKKFLPALDNIITHLAGEVLCGGGGGCGGLA